MGRARVLEEIRIMRFEGLLERHERGYLTQGEAGEMLGVSERTFRRWRERYREEGSPGLGDRRIGKPSPRRADAGELARARALYADMYQGFTVKPFHEHLVARHGYRHGYTVTRLALQGAGLVTRSTRRGAHRRRRPRRPLPGMLLHQDGSTHAWLEGQPPLDLIVTLDDATSEIYSAFLVAEEGTASSFRGLAETIARKGLFCSLYTDRGGHYFRTPAAGGRVSREPPTQVGRALAELGIEHTSRPTPRRRAGAPSAPSAPCRTGWSRRWRSPASPPSRPPTASSPRPTCRRTTSASRSRRKRPAPPSSPARPRPGATSSAVARPARSATTTP